VFLTEAGDKTIAGIKAIRLVTRLGLKDAKDIFDAAPTVVLSGLTLEQAESAAAELRKAGMTVEIRDD
jgi:large subunit ribosomal protein L7/L12